MCATAQNMLYSTMASLVSTTKSDNSQPNAISQRCVPKGLLSNNLGISQRQSNMEIHDKRLQEHDQH